MVVGVFEVSERLASSDGEASDLAGTRFDRAIVFVDDDRVRRQRELGGLGGLAAWAGISPVAATRIALDRILGVDQVPLHLVAGTAMGIIAPLVLVLAVERVGFAYAFTVPKDGRLFTGRGSDELRPPATEAGAVTSSS